MRLLKDKSQLSLAWKSLPVVVLSVLAWGCGSSPAMATYQGENWTESFMQADFTRVFRVHVPKRTELGPVAPVVLAFHGVGQNGELLEAQSGLSEMADREGVIVVYMEAAMGAWDIFHDLGSLALDELAYVREVIDRVSARYVIDQDRIVAVGFSNGAVMAQQVGCSLSHRVAGFVSVAATMPKRLEEGCHPDHPMNVLYLVGTADRYFPAAGSNILLSLNGVLQLWAAKNRCDRTSRQASLPDISADSTTATVIWFTGCRDGVRVVLDRIEGGGHTWPGAVSSPSSNQGPTSHDLSANEEIARFLHSLRRD